MTRLDRYLFRQLFLSLIAISAGLALLVWLTQSLRFIELVLERGLSLAVFLELTSLMLPSFLAVILPIATFLVVLFLYVRLGLDRELVVMWGAGLSPWRVARPALWLALLATGLCLLLNLWLVPLSHTAFRQWQFEIRNQLVGLLLQEGVFSQVGEDFTVYARRRDPDGTLRGILVHDQRDPTAPVTLLAEQGRLVFTPSGPRVTLLNGVRQHIERAPAAAPGMAPLRLNVLTFRENSIDLAYSRRGEEARWRDARERTVAELLFPDPAEGLREREIRRFFAEGHQRLATPFTALSFTLIALAVALSGSLHRHGGQLRLVVGIAIVIGLLACGLVAGSFAARDSAWVPLIWVQALLPGLLALWWLLALPRSLLSRANAVGTGVL